MTAATPQSSPIRPVHEPRLVDDPLLTRVHAGAFQYFLDMICQDTGLVLDTSRPGSPASIAATGFGLGAYVVGSCRGYISRADAAAHTLRILRFFAASEQSMHPEATGYKGFYYHFLKPKTGQREWECELSVIDTALLMIGVLLSATFYDAAGPEEAEIRQLAHQLYDRVDWCWAQDGKVALSHGWTPEAGFIHYNWDGYSEALFLYALALGAPTLGLPAASYQAWAITYQWENLYGIDHLYAGPMFIHQFSPAWLDLRLIQDDFMREKHCDYFENSRRATYVQQAYAMHNPHSFTGYGPFGWGLSADEGPGFLTKVVDGRSRNFAGYDARAMPYGLDDGTLSPASVVASLPFAPELVVPTLRHMTHSLPELWGSYGVKGSYNLSFEEQGTPWIVEPYYALDVGLSLLMVENAQTGLVWEVMRRCPAIIRGLNKAGFTGGWLDKAEPR